MSKDVARLHYDGKSTDLAVVHGTEGEIGVDIGALRSDAGIITLDPGYGNTGSTKSEITYIDGNQGILRYRGIPIDDLADNSTFIETSYLLIYGKLPTQRELADFEDRIRHHTMVHEDIRRVIDSYPATTHPMAILSSTVCALSSFYDTTIERGDQEAIDMAVIRLLAKVPTIAAYSYKKGLGQPYIFPKNHLDYCGNLLHMMFAVPTEEYELDADAARTLDLMFILHADHEQNCSTSTVRLVGSAQTNIFATIAAGICALWGPLHGGANEAVVRMLQKIHDDGGGTDKYVAMAKDRNSDFRLMGFGHRVYKNHDPRATVIRHAAERLLKKIKRVDPLLDIAVRLEEVALRDEYFIERKLYPNVDFYSGVIYRALQIPLDMFTVMFALGRLPGWIAHWREMLYSPDRKIGRPRQIYMGHTQRPYVPMNRR